MNNTTDNNPAFDVLVIGSGAAGLSLALEMADKATVGVISKGELTEGSTYYAQGGIAAVLDETDTVESHIQDTLDSGAGLCDPDAVRFVVENGRIAIQKLIDLGVDFSRDPDPEKTGQEYHLTREGGHSHRRVIHAADATGRAVETTLVEKVQTTNNITLLDHHMAIDLIRDKRGDKRCIGAYALDIKNDRVIAYGAKAVVLATGGASKAYLYTSNPDGSTGDGIAMAWRAGANVANMEFTQFHPTCLFHPEAKSFLVTEAVRGEGGKLRLGNTKRFMDKFDDRGELAPRDIVARAIDHEMKRTGDECVYLDITDKPVDFIREHFPTVYKRCLDFGFDMTEQSIPVVPAAHYTCGGVKTDLAGRTSIDGLYAIGEVACTGLHGANRIASNSLLECLVLGAASAKDILENLDTMPDAQALTPWDESWVRDSDEDVVVSHNWDEVRRFMWDYVGIVRTDKRLERAKHRIDLLQTEINDYYGNFRITGDLLELRNLVVVADLIVRSAMCRKESRGLHYTLDYPDTDAKQASPTMLDPERNS
ncbi:MAG: L-aspartate oxidase [Rhodospirillaceae bacterium]|jgi:L-aspartate oxidase|nr:L-aspartate oxidase [Rhodospirillaceae bacterium]MBT4463601.1 L-aspartate oxidase [Rhodospirillaceae bacterium]MBT6407603.1 L-aspartate oxidase [Rhodospirillaceae bacterium]MBT7356151.1 L-aspartate oxidase [Rhodospirillaceae bacterium]